MDIKDYVKDCTVEFMFYREWNLWYKTIGSPTEFEFPVPVHDRDEVGNATFSAKDKALFFMRYIRKHIDFMEILRKNHEEENKD